MQKLKKFTTLPWHMKILYLEAFTCQLSTGLLLKIVPFKHISRLFASSSQKSKVESQKSKDSRLTTHDSRLTSHVSPLTTHPSPKETLQSIKEALQSTSPYSPWRNRCLVQSLAAKRMLNRRKIPSQLSLGMTKDIHGRVIAHAWLRADDVEIVEKNGDYTELYMF